MKPLRMRFKVRHLVEAVAAVALLIPFPGAALVFLFATFATWYFLPIVIVWICDKVGGGRLAVIASVIMVGAGSYLLSGPYFFGMRSLWWAMIPLTALHLSGPFYVAWRLWRDKSLVSGEILWAWLGLIWTMMPTFLRRNHGWIDSLEMLVGCARLTLVLAGFLVLHGTRPPKPRRAWAHYLGWGLVECDVILWGWFANPYF